MKFYEHELIIRELVLNKTSEKIAKQIFPNEENKERNKLYIKYINLPEEYEIQSKFNDININQLNTFYRSLSSRYGSDFTKFFTSDSDFITEGRTGFHIGQCYSDKNYYIRCHLSKKNTPNEVLIRNRDKVYVIIPSTSFFSGILNHILCTLNLNNCTDVIYIKNKNKLLNKIKLKKDYIIKLAEGELTKTLVNDTIRLIKDVKSDNFYLSMYKTSGEDSRDKKRINLCLYT